MEKIIKRHPTFDKHYRKRILPHPNLDIKFQERITLFIFNPMYPLLKDHPLTGKKAHLRSFSITGDIRVIYQEIFPGEILLIDIGTHNQVY
ncbi:type II toxin-antitoxin system YafQ family toxin [Candidatus Gottesmanbacteria bacterium]|nr:type II toxin-antitoxin system YafQ family toxin [Candidatus Gottesmanbacteria bacterium]